MKRLILKALLIGAALVAMATGFNAYQARPASMMLLMPAGVAIAALVVAIGVWKRDFSPNARTLTRRVLRCHGASRCTAAIALFDYLAQHPEAAPGAWNEVEQPLREALPDCPPAFRTMLRAALEAAGERCPDPGTAARMAQVREAAGG